MKGHVIALDQGTTSSRAIIFNEKGEIVSLAQRPFPQIYPRPGWVEHDPMDILSSQFGALAEAFEKSGLERGDIAAIGVTNQRETAIVWDRATGRPVYNAIVWQCRRTAPICDRLASEGLGAYVRDKTGLLIDAYFSGTKIKWILDNVPGARERAEKGELLFGNVDSWLIWNPHRRARAHLRLLQLLAHHALRHRPPALGQRALPRAGRAGADAARAGAQLGGVRPRGPGHQRPGGAGGRAHLRQRRRPGRRPAGPGLRAAGGGQEHLRHGLLHAGQHRPGAASAACPACSPAWPGA